MEVSGRRNDVDGASDEDERKATEELAGSPNASFRTESRFQLQPNGRAGAGSGQAAQELRSDFRISLEIEWRAQNRQEYLATAAAGVAVGREELGSLASSVQTESLFQARHLSPKRIAESLPSAKASDECLRAEDQQQTEGVEWTSASNILQAQSELTDVSQIPADSSTHDTHYDHLSFAPLETGAQNTDPTRPRALEDGANLLTLEEALTELTPVNQVASQSSYFASEPNTPTAVANNQAPHDTGLMMFDFSSGDEAGEDSERK